MSRANLVAAAKSVGVAVMTRENGKTGWKTLNCLRRDILTRCYGPGMHFEANSPAEFDAIAFRSVACETGKLGHLLRVGQHALRVGNEERIEHQRLCGLKKRRPDDEARILRSARQYLEIARISQELAALEMALEEPANGAERDEP